MTNPFNVEKAAQKYQQLAKDALTAGDPVLHENYLQHAEHFNRRLAELNGTPKEQKIVSSTDDKKIVSSNKDQKVKSPSLADELNNPLREKKN